MKTNKLALALIMAAGSIISAFAGNMITLGDGGTISLKPGGTKVIAVNLQNDDEFGALQFDMEFTSDKVSIVEGSLTVNDERADRKLFMTTLYHMENGKWRLSVLTRPSAINTVSGNEGALAYFTIKAADDFTKDDGAKIYFSTSSGGDKEGNKILISTPAYQAITPLVGSFALGEKAFSIKPGGIHKVDVLLNNEVLFNGLQTDIAIPAGLTIEKNDAGMYRFEYSDRLSNNFMISSALQKDGKVRVMLSSLPIDVIRGKEGRLFSFNVVADENFVSDDNSVISFHNTVAAADAGVVEYSLDTGNATAKVTSLKGANDAAYIRLSEEVSALQKALDDAKANVAEECKDVAGDYAEAAEAVQAQINAIKTGLDSRHASCDLTEKSVLDTEKVNAVKEAISKYIADAHAAQTEFARRAANEEAFQRLSADVAAVQARFDEVKKTIAEQYADVAGLFAGTEITIQLEIDRTSKELRARYDDVELTAESQLDLQALKDAIEQLLAEAKKAAEASGINGMPQGTEGAEPTGIYTLDGKETAVPRKGHAYIVRYAGGKTKKLFIR